MAFWRRHSGSADYLAGVGFFAGSSPEELERIAHLGREREFPEAAVLTDQGRVGQDCFVLVEGHCSVYVGGEWVASLGPGSMVGEMALIDHRPRRATVITSEPVKALSFDTKAFRTLLAEFPALNDRVRRLLVARLEVDEALLHGD
jgi:CRP-like cAMP-binding protein